MMKTYHIKITTGGRSIELSFCNAPMRTDPLTALGKANEGLKIETSVTHGKGEGK